jgi:hypothetical protein
VSKTLHEGHSAVIIGILESDLVRNQLIMETRLGESLRRSQALVDNVDDVLHCCGDDSAASFCAGDQQ